MAIKIKFDSAGHPQPLRLILATKAGRFIRELPMSDIKFHDTMTDGSEISFTVYKNACVDEEGLVDESFWRKITDFKTAYCPEQDIWYELYVNINESDATVKSIQATSLGEAELSQINVYNMEINTEADIARDDYRPTTLYNDRDKTVSLIDRLLNKAPHYRVAHVDSSVMNIQRTFEFSGKSIHDCCLDVAKEMDVLFLFECRMGTSPKIDRTVSIYDLENSCEDCGKRGDFIDECPECGGTNIRKGYGEDTTIFVSRDNLAKDITYSTDIDSVKNCFRLEGGDDLMTSTIISCNPNGSQYLWYIPEEIREDMSQELRDRLDEYDELHELYRTGYGFRPPAQLRAQYNAIVGKYLDFNDNLQEMPYETVGYPALMTAYYNTVDLQLFLNSELMPNVEVSGTDAVKEAKKIRSQDLSPVAVANITAVTEATATNAVLGMAKCMVRPTYQVKVKESSFNTTSKVWTGSFTVTNYADEEDTADSRTVSIQVNGDMVKYTKQKIKKTMSQGSDGATDIQSLFKLEQSEFETELGKYSLQRLLAFRDACEATLNTMIQQGMATPENDLYQELYLPYRLKASAIDREILVRSEELAVVAGIYDENGGLISDGMQSIIAKKRDEVQEIQNFENFLGTELWHEFASYRREDTYSNSNYISDGLDNEQLFARAQQFIEAAEKDIAASATLQHSVSASIWNLLAMREFQPITEYFACGNWIRLAVDGKVYRLRLKEYTVSYNDWGLEVEFTDVKYGHSSASDIVSILDAAKAMTTSYGAVARQAEQAKVTKHTMDSWVDKGFQLTAAKIVGGAENQEFLINQSGITGREYIPETESYAPEQMRIISSGLYVTDDGWLTAKAGVGKFTYFDPKTQTEQEAFGVIADTIVGNIMLSKTVGIYNDGGSISMDEDGFTLITDDEDGNKVFQILHRDQNGVLKTILSVDSSGNLLLDGYSSMEMTQDFIHTEVGKSRARSFITTPIPPYNVGEIWFDEASGDLLTCINAKEEGEQYDPADWDKLLKYTDDTMALLKARELEESLSTFSSSVTQLASSFEVRIDETTSRMDQFSTSFRVTNRGAEISKSENGVPSDTVLVCSNDQISLEVNGEVVTYWNTSEQYLPKMVNIPVGGSLRLGSIQFLPRSSGNLSLVWVGE